MIKNMDGSVKASEFDRVRYQLLYNYVLKYFGVSSKDGIKDKLTEDPQWFYEKLKSIPKDDEIKYGGILQLIGSIVSGRLEKKLREVSKKYGLDFYKLLSLEYNEIDNIYYKIYKKLLEYEIKTKRIFENMKKTFFIIPNLYIKKIDKDKFFIINKYNGRWSIVNTIEPLKEDYYIKIIGEIYKMGENLYIEHSYIREDDRAYLQKLFESGVIYRSDKKNYFGNHSCDINPTLLHIVLSTNCNMACKYCYESKSNFEIENPNIEKIQSSIVNIINRYPNIRHVVFFGGEPLIYMNLIMQLTYHPLISPLKKSIQTNLTLLNEDITKFLKKHEFDIGVSLDGPEEFNKLRVYKNGKESYEDVIKNIKILTSNNIRFGLLGVVHKENHKFKNMLEWAQNLGASSVHYNIEVGEYATTPMNLFKFFKNSFEDYVNGNYKIRYRTFIWYIDSLLLPSPQRELICSRNPCGAARAHLSINPNGTISPCPEIPSIRANTVDEIYTKFRGILSHFNEIYDNPYINIGAFCFGKNYMVNKKINKVVTIFEEFYDLIYPWLADKIVNDPMYLKVYKKWKSRPIQITQVK